MSSHSLRVAHAEVYEDTKSERRVSTLNDLDFCFELALDLLNAKTKTKKLKRV